MNEMTTNEAIIHSQSEVRGNNLCTHLREASDLSFQTEKNVAFDNAVIAKDIIRLFNEGEIDVSEIQELVDEGVSDDFETDLTGKKRREQLVKVLTRYCKSETRKLIVPTEAVIIDVNGSLFRVKPDAIFDDGKEIESILYRNALPNVTQTGKKRDGAVSTCTELYLLNEAAKQMVPYGETRKLKASYYFLKKHGDSYQWTSNFFDGQGRNIVTLEDVYTNDGGETNTETDNDKTLKAMIDEWEIGRECSAEDCATCKMNLACNFVKAPDHQPKVAKEERPVVLTEAQAQVVNATKGVIRVVAGAGAGKTECVVQRVVKLIQDSVKAGMSLKDSCKQILMITFTEAGCKEMKSRVARRLEQREIYIDADDLKVATFNQFAFDIVRAHYTDLGFSKEPHVIDDVRESVIITQMLNENIIPQLDYLHFSQNDKNTKGALAVATAVFTKMKELQIDPTSDQAMSDVSHGLNDTGMNRFIDGQALGALIMLYDDFVKRLIADNLVLFADQEPMMLEVLAKNPEMVDQMGYAHIIVDEFQDSNDVQMQTIKLLTTAKSFKSLMVVGDDSQSIFGFRNTTPENILHFFEKMGVKDGIDLRLVDNHRSTPDVLALANSINGLNKNRIDKDLIASRQSLGYKPVVQGFHSKADEYAYIAEECRRLIDEEGYAPEDIAFICFTNAELIAIGAKLSAAGIPWVMMNPTVLMTNSRVIAAMSLAEAFWQPDCTQLYFNYLTALYDGDILNVDHAQIRGEVEDMAGKFQNMDSLAIPAQREIFHQYLEKLKTPLRVSVEDGSINIVEETEDIDDEIYNYFLELLYQCEDFQSELQYVHDFKRYGAKVAKRMEQSYQGVVLTTAHSSKGLEWKVVFNSITNYDNMFLHGNHEQELEERRRLLFVSMTRARDRLYVTGQYVAYGDESNRTYNQFLREAFEQNGDKYDPVDPMAAIKKAERRAKAAEAAKKRREKSKDAWAGFTKNLPGQLSF